MARVLDGTGHHPLLACVNTGDAARKDLPLVVEESSEQLQVGIIDVLDALDRISLLATSAIARFRTKKSFITSAPRISTLVVTCHDLRFV